MALSISPPSNFTASEVVVNLSGQTTAISSTTLSSNSDVGVYEVSAQVEVTAVGTAGTISAVVTYTDDIGSNALSLVTTPTLTSTSRTFGIASGIYNLASTNSFSYSTTFNSVTGSPAYRLVIVLKRIG